MAQRRRIQIVCPAKPGSRFGNRITALRWQVILRKLGHQTSIVGDWHGSGCDLLIALHARRSSAQVLQFRKQHAGRPIIVALTGTDLYREFSTAAAQASVRTADRIVVLQAEALRDLSATVRKKTRVIYQSARPVSVRRARNPRQLRVIVAGHLREVKDPFRAAMAVRALPSKSRIVVHHFGAAMSDAMEKRAQREMLRNDRYRWFGGIPQGELRRKVAHGWLMVLSSKMEGGANVIAEATADRVPVLASRIPGSIGMLGDEYAGFFPFGDTRRLRALLWQCEQDPTFYGALATQIDQRAQLFEPLAELDAWKRLLAEL